MEKLEQAGQLVNSFTIERPYSEPGLLLGTSSFTADGWQGSFYPPGMQTRERTPPDFVFAAKVPQFVTYEKVWLANCYAGADFTGNRAAKVG